MLAAAAAALVLAAPLQARTTPHHRWSSMTLTERRAVVVREIRRQRAPVRWWVRHRKTRAFLSSAAPLPFCRAIGIAAPGPVCLAGQRLVHALLVKRNLDAQIARAEQRRLAAAFPPHHNLWTCIGRHEGGVTSVNPNGHYGMLQMHWNWGYGIVGAASNYTQAQQEWAAEHGYAAANYHTSFLWDQWFKYDGAAAECLPYA